MKKIILSSAFSLFIFLVSGCTKEENPIVDPPPKATRSFYMGFTPFPYDISNEAVDYVYNKLATDADIISHHFDDGVPWPEALNGSDFHINIMNDWQYRLSRTPASHKILLSVTPIRFFRDGLAPYKAEKGDLPLPAPWDTISFNHPDVKQAFLNYCVRIKNYFNPDFFVIGIEVNLLMIQAPGLWDEYLELHQYVYQQLKILDPQLPILVSVTGMDLVEGYTNANHSQQRQVLNDIMNYTDLCGVSLYPYLTGFLCDTIPSDMFEKIFSYLPKDKAICETGYAADSITVYGGTVVLNGSPQKQNQYLTLLMNKAEQYDLKFVVNFVLRDYDALWEDIGSPDDLNKVWKDTGIYDENGNARLAYQNWYFWLNKQVQPSN